MPESANPLREGLRMERTPQPNTVVIFGASGGLARQLSGRGAEALEPSLVDKELESIRRSLAESAAELMTGWLLSRLDREPAIVRRDQIAITVADDGGPVFRSLDMRCREAEFSVARTGPDTVEARARLDSESITRISRIPLASLEKLPADELGRTGRDRAYDAAVQAAVGLPQR